MCLPPGKSAVTLAEDSTYLAHAKLLDVVWSWAPNTTAGTDVTYSLTIHRGSEGKKLTSAFLASWDNDNPYWDFTFPMTKDFSDGLLAVRVKTTDATGTIPQIRISPP